MFNNKKDPLVDAVKGIMEASAREREIERKLNESLGITSKKALPHELHSEYDAVLKESIAGSQINEVSEKLLKRAKQKAKDNAMVAWELNDKKTEDKNEKRAEKFSAAIEKKKADGKKPSLKKKMEEEKLSPKQGKLAALAGDEDEIEAVDLKALRSGKTLDEAKATEAQKEKVAKVMHKWKQGKEHIGKSDKTVPVTKKGQKQAVAIALSQAGLSKKMDESNSFNLVQEEIRTNLLERIRHIYESEGADAANAYFETLSEEERGILGEQSPAARAAAERMAYNVSAAFKRDGAREYPIINKYGSSGVARVSTMQHRDGYPTNKAIEGYSTGEFARRISNRTDERIAQRMSGSPVPPGGGAETGRILPKSAIRPMSQKEIETRPSGGAVPSRKSPESRGSETTIRGPAGPSINRQPVDGVDPNSPPIAPEYSRFKFGGKTPSGTKVPEPTMMDKVNMGLSTAKKWVNKIDSVLPNPPVPGITGELPSTEQPKATSVKTEPIKIPAPKSVTNLGQDINPELKPSSAPAIPATSTSPTPASAAASSVGQELRQVGGNAAATSDTEAGRRKLEVLNRRKPEPDAFQRATKGDWSGITGGGGA